MKLFGMQSNPNTSPRKKDLLSILSVLTAYDASQDASLREALLTAVNPMIDAREDKNQLLTPDEAKRKMKDRLYNALEQDTTKRKVRARVTSDTFRVQLEGLGRDLNTLETKLSELSDNTRTDLDNHLARSPLPDVIVNYIREKSRTANDIQSQLQPIIAALKEMVNERLSAAPPQPTRQSLSEAVIAAGAYAHLGSTSQQRVGNADHISTFTEPVRQYDRANIGDDTSSERHDNASSSAAPNTDTRYGQYPSNTSSRQSNHPVSTTDYGAMPSQAGAKPRQPQPSSTERRVPLAAIIAATSAGSRYGGLPAKDEPANASDNTYGGVPGHTRRPAPAATPTATSDVRYGGVPRPHAGQGITRSAATPAATSSNRYGGVPGAGRQATSTPLTSAGQDTSVPPTLTTYGAVPQGQRQGRGRGRGQQAPLQSSRYGGVPSRPSGGAGGTSSSRQPLNVSSDGRWKQMASYDDASAASNRRDDAPSPSDSISELYNKSSSSSSSSSSESHSYRR